jgi:transcriptional regulator with XRE-family HTH domain
MSRSKEMFKFTPEMGSRLRGLRVAAGLTQQELAVLMGRQGKGNHQLIGKVELGKAPYPSLGFVADYLRACRVSFGDIADLLNAYTSQPTVIEQRGYKRVQSLARKLSRRVAKAVVRYDIGVTRSKSKPESVRKRVVHAKAYAHAQEAQRRLASIVAEEIARAGIKPASVDALRLRLYARKLWRLLNRSSKGERKLKLAKLDRWVTAEGIQSHPLLPALRDHITALAADRTPQT